MIRLLHVHNCTPDFQTARAVEQLSHSLSEGFQVRTLTIGPGGHFRNFPSAAIALRRETHTSDVVHAWGMSALAATAFAGFERIVFTPISFPTRRQIAWLRAVLTYRDVQIVCPTSTLRRTLIERGVPLPRCHLVRPGVDFARVKRRRDPALRAALGFADDDQVLLGVGESTRAADHRQLVWTATILNVLDRKTRVLLWGRGPLARSAATFAAKLAQSQMVTLPEQRLSRRLDFEELFPAADLIVISATAPVSTLPIAIAMAAALPIVATVTPTVAELLEDRHTALMTQPAIPRLLAQRIHQMREDPQAQWKLADMARIEAYEYFSLTRFIEQSRTLYQQVSTSAPVQIPEPAPGAGLRFHGRA